MTEDDLTGLILGAINPWNLPPFVRDVWWLAYDHACTTLRHELRQLEARIDALERQVEQAEFDADRWFEKAHNPGKQLTDIRQRRIEEALDASGSDGLTEPQQLVVMLNAARAPRRAA